MSEPVSWESLRIAVDRDADIPIGVQVAWALRARISDGSLAPGQRLPGLRDLAEGLGVNPNTIRAVYQRLEQEGLLNSQQGSGTFVSLAAGSPGPAGAIAATAAREAQETGVDPREVAAALYVAVPSVAPALEEGAGLRRLLRTQITVLDQTLSELEARYPGLGKRPDETASGKATLGPRLLGVEELEQVKTQLIRGIIAIQGAVDAIDVSVATPSVEPAAATKVAPKRGSQPRVSGRPAPSGT